jgi:hypothetical protein
MSHVVGDKDNAGSQRQTDRVFLGELRSWWGPFPIHGASQGRDSNFPDTSLHLIETTAIDPETRSVSRKCACGAEWTYTDEFSDPFTEDREPYPFRFDSDVPSEG